MSWFEWTMHDHAPRGWAHHGLAVLDDGTLLA
jgi:hypothetical protein